MKIENIWNKLFTVTDNTLKENINSITCADICNMYTAFTDNLRIHKGNANGFPGLSEYLIFRYIYNMLGGEFNTIENTDIIYEFQSKKDSNYYIGQNIRVDLSKGKRCYPDIVISTENNILSTIQIKLYLTNGLKEIEKEMLTFKELRKKNRQMKALSYIMHYPKTEKYLLN